MRLRAAAWVCLALAIAASRPASSIQPDVERERRWAEQVVPQIVVGEAVWLATSRHPRVLALFAEPMAETRNAVVVVHGMGVNPDWNLIGTFRTVLADLGFATLSVQMPVLSPDASRDGYATTFPDAAERLDAAVDWLRARNYSKIAVVSHSMGAAMVNSWLAKQQRPEVDAWVPVGLLVDFAAPPRVPVLDVVAEHDFPEALAFAKTRAAKLRRDGCSAPMVVAGTDHYFGTVAARLAASIKPFLARALGGGC